MSIQDFIKFLKSFVSIPFYPNAFPATAPVQSIMVEVGQGIGSRGSVSDVTLTLTVRAEKMGKAESISQEIINKLDGLTDEPIGESGQIVLIKSQQLVPSYLGKSDSDNHYYMNNFRVLVND